MIRVRGASVSQPPVSTALILLRLPCFLVALDIFKSNYTLKSVWRVCELKIEINYYLKNSLKN